LAIALTIAFTATPLAAGQKLLVEATKQLSPGVGFINPTWYKQIFVGAAATASPANVLSAYTTRFGSLISGKKIAFRLTALTVDGQRSAPLEVVQTVT
jgi:hypothetical protein